MTDWPVKTLGEVCDLVGGGTPSKDRLEFYGGEIPWATVRDLNVEVLRTTEHSITAEAVKSSSSNIIPAGSVVIATRVGLGKAVKIAQDTAINQDLRGLVVKKPKELIADYLYWWYLSTVHLVVAAGTGATVQGVKLPFVSGLAIPVPPLEEQKRIVGVLDAATARVTELTACYEQARTHANNLFSSALRDALVSNPDWPVKTLGDFCDIYQPQTIGIKDLVADGKYIVYGANGPIGRYDRFNHGKSEVTVTCRGATCGTVNVTPPEVWITGNAMVVRPDEMEMSKEMICYVLEGLDYSRIITGAAQPQITRQTLAPSTIQIPPLEEQKRIVARPDLMRAKTSEMVVAYGAKLSAAKTLRRSILEAAFAGDL